MLREVFFYVPLTPVAEAGPVEGGKGKPRLLCVLVKIDVEAMGAPIY
jgi:hypothetical protein